MKLHLRTPSEFDLYTRLVAEDLRVLSHMMICFSPCIHRRCRCTVAPAKTYLRTTHVQPLQHDQEEYSSRVEESAKVMRDRSAITMTTYISASPEHAPIHAPLPHVHANICNFCLDQITVDT
jgi:hypothetical protein